METITILILTFLFAKHIIADYFLQRSWMFKDKGIYLARGGLIHAKSHGVLTFFALLFLSVDPMLALGLGCLDAVLHYHIDYIKSNVWKSKQLTPNDNLYWAVHGVDQFTHFLTYILIVLIHNNSYISI